METTVLLAVLSLAREMAGATSSAAILSGKIKGRIKFSKEKHGDIWREVATALAALNKRRQSRQA
jgi:hypothetical protein